MRKAQRQERSVPVNIHVCLEQYVEASGRQRAKGTGVSPGAGEKLRGKQGTWCFQNRARSGSRKKGDGQLS